MVHQLRARTGVADAEDTLGCVAIWREDELSVIDGICDANGQLDVGVQSCGCLTIDLERRANSENPDRCVWSV